MVLKYLGLAGITYGTHAFLAIMQVLLCIFLITNGLILLLSTKPLGKWLRRLGLLNKQEMKVRGGVSWLMIAAGVALILPLFGVTSWVAVLACPIAIFSIIKLTDGDVASQPDKAGNLPRKVLMASAMLIFGFTIWEGRDLVRAGWDVNYKAVYWRHKEVSVWQSENNPNVPKVGELAPDFELADVTGTKTVRLSDFRGDKPVVLLFGSFT